MMKKMKRICRNVYKLQYFYFIKNFLCKVMDVLFYNYIGLVLNLVILKIGWKNLY